MSYRFICAFRHFKSDQCANISTQETNQRNMILLVYYGELC